MRLFLSLSPTWAWLVSHDAIGIFSTSTRASSTTRAPAHISGLALLSPLPVLVSSAQLLGFIRSMAMHVYSGIPAVISAPLALLPTPPSACACADGPMPVPAWLRVAWDART